VKIEGHVVDVAEVGGVMNRPNVAFQFTFGFVMIDEVNHGLSGKCSASEIQINGNGQDLT
jgi:hypothetical protein